MGKYDSLPDTAFGCHFENADYDNEKNDPEKKKIISKKQTR